MKLLWKCIYVGIKPEDDEDYDGEQENKLIIYTKNDHIALPVSSSGWQFVDDFDAGLITDEIEEDFWKAFQGIHSLKRLKYSQGGVVHYGQMDLFEKIVHLQALNLRDIEISFISRGFFISDSLCDLLSSLKLESFSIGFFLQPSSFDQVKRLLAALPTSLTSLELSFPHRCSFEFAEIAGLINLKNLSLKGGCIDSSELISFSAIVSNLFSLALWEVHFPSACFEFLQTERFREMKKMVLGPLSRSCKSVQLLRFVPNLEDLKLFVHRGDADCSALQIGRTLPHLRRLLLAGESSFCYVSWKNLLVEFPSLSLIEWESFPMKIVIWPPPEKYAFNLTLRLQVILYKYLSDSLESEAIRSKKRKKAH
jgi:hypothetical protein